MSASIARHHGASVACATKSHRCYKAATIVSDVLERLVRFLEPPTGQWVWVQAMSRPPPTGIRPTSDRSDTIREMLAHTLRGLGIMGPAAAAS